MKILAKKYHKLSLNHSFWMYVHQLSYLGSHIAWFCGISWVSELMGFHGDIWWFNMIYLWILWDLPGFDGDLDIPWKSTRNGESIGTLSSGQVWASRIYPTQSCELTITNWDLTGTSDFSTSTMVSWPSAERNLARHVYLINKNYIIGICGVPQFAS